MPSFELSTKHKKVVVPESPQLLQLLPNAKQLAWNGAPHVVVNHTEEATKLLRNLGFAVPAPSSVYYDWNRGTPFQAQKSTVDMLTVEKRAYVLNGMGTGKTKAALWAFDWLKKQALVNRLLVVAPLSTLTQTWLREIFLTTPHLRGVVLHGSADVRKKRLADKSYDIYIINHDGVRTVRKELTARTDIDVVVLDELAVYRNNSTRSKVMKGVLANKQRVWGMTGTPAPNEPADVWGQANLVTPWTIPTSRTAFYESLMRKVSNFTWVPKPGATERAFSVLQPSVRFTLDDVTELPEVVFETVKITQGAKQKLVYESLEKHLHAMFLNGEITIANSAVLANKLLQISMGWVYNNDRGVVALDNDDRLATLLEKVESSDRKVIVFVPYVHALDGVSQYLTKHGIKNVTVSGSVTKTQRDEIFKAFQHTTGSGTAKVIVAHPQCMSHGLTLTAADTIIWFGPYASLEIFEQANARISRVGQQHRQHVIMLSGTPVEDKLYQRLRSKQKVQSLLLDMFQSNTR